MKASNQKRVVSLTPNSLARSINERKQIPRLIPKPDTNIAPAANANPVRPAESSAALAAELSPKTPSFPDTPTNESKRNGDETDVRRDDFQKILGHSAAPLPDRMEQNIIESGVAEIVVNPDTPVNNGEQPIADIEFEHLAYREDDSTARTKTMSALIEEIREMDRRSTAQHRELARAMARLRDEFDLTQTEIANALGKVQGWVSRILKWHDDGFVEETPFGSFSRAKRARAKTKAAPGPTPEEYHAPDNLNLDADASAEARKQQYAAQEMDDGETRAADGFSGPDLDGVIDDQGAAADHKARHATGDTKQVKKGSQEHWLSEFRAACTEYLSKMNPDTLAKAKDLVANWNARITNAV
jgi:hypothetical protein